MFERSPQFQSAQDPHVFYGCDSAFDRPLLGSAWAPVILPVFKTGGRSRRTTVCSTHTRFRQAICRLPVEPWRRDCVYRNTLPVTQLAMMWFLIAYCTSSAL